MSYPLIVKRFELYGFCAIQNKDIIIINIIIIVAAREQEGSRVGRVNGGHGAAEV